MFQDLLSSTSSLSSSLAGHLYTLVLPLQWPDSCSSEDVSVARGHTRHTTADIVLQSHSTPHPIKLYSRPCSMPGRTLLLSSNCAKANSTVVAPNFAKQLVNLKFGVFSQTSEDDDQGVSSKQEVLCENRSVQEVIEQSDEFKRMKNWQKERMK